MRSQRILRAAAAASLAVAAPLSAQDSTSRAMVASDSAAPVRVERRHRTVVFDSTILRRLPVDDVLDVPVLVPGAYGLTDPRAFSVRGGLTGDAAIYVDGALIRNGQRQDAELLPSVRGIQSLGIATGMAPAQFGDLLTGSLQIVTPSGSGRQRWTGGIRYRADDAGPDLWRNIGFHRIEAIADGSLPLGLTAFATVQLDGQQSLETEKDRDVQAPVYIASGTDTIIRQPVDFGNPASDTIDLAIPRFVQYSGYCDASRNGADCRGLQVPYTTRGAQLLQMKLQRVYGTDQHVSLTVLAGRHQARDFPFTALYNPSNRSAARTSSRAVILDWVHHLTSLGGRPLDLNINLSYQSDERAAGALTFESEAESREPVGGFLLSSLKFVTDFSTRHAVTIAGNTYNDVGYLDDLQIKCLQAGQAACQDLVPFLDRNDLISAQPYRMNPYAVEQNVRFPFFTSGLDGPFDLSREHRWQARLGLGWRPAPAHQISAGLDFASSDTHRYTAGMISAVNVNAYAEQPTRTAAYVQDQVNAGAFELIGSLRVDRFDSRALFPIVPGRISSITDPIAISGTDTFRLAPFDPLDPTANFRRASAHTIVSPQLRLLFDAWPNATVWFGIGRQARNPSFESLFAYKNTDLTQTNRAVAFGRDLEPAHADVIEAGAHIAMAGDPNTFADLTLYSENLSDEAVRREQFADPGAGGFPAFWFVNAITDRGKLRGIDAMLARRFSELFTGTVSLSHQDGPAIDGARTFASALAALTFGKQAPLGDVLANTDIFTILRFSSNRHYTLQRNSGDGFTIGDPGFFPLEEENSSTLPLLKTIDIRITRSFPLGQFGGAVFIESKNLFNWTNLTDIFTETGKATNDLYRARWVAEQVGQLEVEASQNGLLTVTGTGESAVDLRSPGVCVGWSSRTGNGAGGPADCVLLQRAERRFGNADGLFTRSEYSTSFGAWYDLANAPYRFYGPGRRVRLGVELSF